MTKDLGIHRQANTLEEIFSKLLERKSAEGNFYVGWGSAIDDHHTTFRIS